MTADLEAQVAELRREVWELHRSRERLSHLLTSHILRTDPRLDVVEEMVWAHEEIRTEVEPPPDLSGTLAALVGNLADVRRELDGRRRLGRGRRAAALARRWRDRLGTMWR